MQKNTDKGTINTPWDSFGNLTLNRVFEFITPLLSQFFVVERGAFEPYFIYVMVTGSPYQGSGCYNQRLTSLQLIFHLATWKFDRRR